MIGGMGWRTITLELNTEPTPALAELLGQLVEVAAFHGIDGVLDEPAGYPGIWELTLEANSSFLNGMSRIIADELSQIARDISPTDVALAAMADDVRRQLADQIVSHGD